MAEGENTRRGYLTEDFRLFHLREPMNSPMEFHYHSFHKIMLLLSGRGSYAIEGRRYALEPGDLVLVSAFSLHRPEFSVGAPYERFVLYISPEFLRGAGEIGCDLETPFRWAREDFSFVLRATRQVQRLSAMLTQLELSLAQEGFGQSILCRCQFLEFLITLTRSLSDRRLEQVSTPRQGEKISAVLQYLNLHLTEPISIDALAEQFYLSSSHLMHKFKAETGYTIHNYLLEKRLILTMERVSQGMSLRKASESCGFGDYSTFSRAYKKRFGQSPTASPGDISFQVLD